MRTGIFLVLLGLLAGPALAQSQAWHHNDGVQPLDRLLPEIRRSHPGKFYDAEGPTRGPDGQLHYHLKWMTPDGRLVWLDTDARTGRVLGIMGGRDEPDFYRGGPTPYPGNWQQEPRGHYDHDHDHERFGGEQNYGHNNGGHGNGGHGGESHDRHGRHGW